MFVSHTYTVTVFAPNDLNHFYCSSSVDSHIPTAGDFLLSCSTVLCLQRLIFRLKRKSMNCSWDVSQVIYLFHSNILFFKFKRQAICSVIFFFFFLGSSDQTYFTFFFFFLSKKPIKISTWWEKPKLFQDIFVVVSLSLINMSNIKRKQKSPKQQNLPNRITTVNAPLEIQ